MICSLMHVLCSGVLPRLLLPGRSSTEPRKAEKCPILLAPACTSPRCWNNDPGQDQTWRGSPPTALLKTTGNYPRVSERQNCESPSPNTMESPRDKATVPLQRAGRHPQDRVPSHGTQSPRRMFPSAPMGLKIGSGAISVSKSRAVNSCRAFIQL